MVTLGVANIKIKGKRPADRFQLNTNITLAIRWRWNISKTGLLSFVYGDAVCVNAFGQCVFAEKQLDRQSNQCSKIQTACPPHCHQSQKYLTASVQWLQFKINSSGATLQVVSEAERFLFWSKKKRQIHYASSGHKATLWNGVRGTNKLCQDWIEDKDYVHQARVELLIMSHRWARFSAAKSIPIDQGNWHLGYIWSHSECIPPFSTMLIPISTLGFAAHMKMNSNSSA